MPASSARSSEVFVSHASRDRKIVRRLVRIFKKNGVGYWYSEKHIPGATEWHEDCAGFHDELDAISNGRTQSIFHFLLEAAKVSKIGRQEKEERPAALSGRLAFGVLWAVPEDRLNH